MLQGPRRACPPVRVLLPALLLVLAGCASPEPGDPAPAGDAPAPGEVVLEPCLEHAADMPVEVAEAQRFLPQGMTPRPLGPTGLAALEVIAVECQPPLAGEDGVRALIAWMLVDPPQELQADVAGYLYLFAMTTDDEAVAAALAAVGVPVQLAETSFGTDESPAAFLGRGGASTDAWSVTLETRVAKRVADRSHPVFRVFVGNATGVAGAVDVDAGAHPHHDAGEGSIVVTGDAPFPTPRAPGIAVHGNEGRLGFAPVRLDAA